MDSPTSGQTTLRGSSPEGEGPSDDEGDADGRGVCASEVEKSGLDGRGARGTGRDASRSSSSPSSCQDDTKCVEIQNATKRCSAWLTQGTACLGTL